MSLLLSKFELKDDTLILLAADICMYCIWKGGGVKTINVEVGNDYNNNSN